MQNNGHGWLQQLYRRTDSVHVSIECLNALQIRLVLSVTGFAFARCWFVNTHFFFLHFARHFVTAVTRYPAMRAFQRKRGALVVVEFRRFPTRGVVAARTVGCIFSRGELSRVRIAMAAGAVFWSGAEVDVLQAGLKRWRTMAVATSYSTVRTQKREFRFRMVKAV